ncbi:helix-turn-helix domain-containing protein [Enterococcus sp. CWB-B31]|uniref:helix-turn-helix domain-containing protein n=1 Tax=Enterococcus sp. CWB-B31 TaxID=2885159 RepID=UPI001E61D842|nr:helix-turn-helix transcriptional regulator [Enterococcus sp. CWB-B31]MCB5955960.1 helix-turn-helix domain-containing protein [Enterococcus sp. CWB-B31]
MEIGKTLQNYRKQKGLTQEQLAKILNVSRQTISKWETGRSLPDIENLVWLCDIYKVSLDKLVGREKISYATKQLRRKNKRKDWLQMFPKYTGILLFLLSLILISAMGVGYFQNSKDRAESKDAGLLILYSVVDSTIDKNGNYKSFELENGEVIEATYAKITEYELEKPINKIKTQRGDPSHCFELVKAELLKN